MPALVESMAYNKVEVPWHGLGVPVEADLTPDEMRIKAGLDWTVSLRPLYAAQNELLLKSEMTKVPGHFALMRDSDDSILTVTGNNWKPVQNVDAVDFFTKFVKAGGMTMETMGSLQNGQYIWALAKIGKGFKIGQHDENEGYLLLAHPHLYGQSLILQTTAIRVVCWNTYSAALKQNGNRWAMRHSRTFDEPTKTEAEAALGMAVEQFTEFKETAQFLARSKANDEWVKKYFYDVLQIKPKEKKAANDDGENTDQRSITRMMEVYENAAGQKLSTARGTWWGAFNAVTFVNDHVIGREQDSRLARAWFGDRAAQKRQALEKALEYSKVAA